MLKQFLNLNRVLVLSPHPDDIEFSGAGSILKHPDTHFTVLNMTSGGDFDTTTAKADRLSEVTNFWKGVSNVEVHFTDIPYLKSQQEDGWVNLVETKFDISSFDAILTTNQIDSHFEHRMVNNIALALARVAKIGVVEYRSPSTLVEWTPNLFVDISKEYKEKVERLGEFKSQSHRSYFQPNQLKGFHTNFQASKRGLELVEMFNIRQMYA